LALLKESALRTQFIPSTLGNEKDNPRSQDLHITMNPTLQVHVLPLLLRYTSMVIGDAREDQKTCFHIIISGIWLIALPSLCSVCEGLWSCGRKRKEEKEERERKRLNFYEEGGL
jgi:hypothetical protein